MSLSTGATDRLFALVYSAKDQGEKKSKRQNLQNWRATFCNAAFCRKTVQIKPFFFKAWIIYLRKNFIWRVKVCVTHTHTPASESLIPSVTGTVRLLDSVHVTSVRTSCCHLSLTLPTTGGLCVWINLNQPSSCDIRSVSLRLLCRGVWVHISGSMWAPVTKVYSSVCVRCESVSQLQLWAVAADQTIGPRQDSQKLKGFF